jgi:hypothetical protein
MARDKSKRRGNFNARKERIARRARSRMLLAGIAGIDRHGTREGPSTSLRQSKTSGGEIHDFSCTPPRLVPREKETTK